MPTPTEDNYEDLFDEFIPNAVIKDTQNPVEQFVKQIGVGAVEAVGSIPKVAQWATQTPVFKDFTDNVDSWVQEHTPEDLGVAGQVGRFLGGAAPMFIPGLGVMRGMQVLKYSAKIARATGAGADAILNGASIAGMTYSQELKKTGSTEIANDRANKAFMLNAAVAAPMYYFGPLGQTRKINALGKIDDDIAALTERNLLKPDIELTKQINLLTQQRVKVAAEKEFLSGYAEQAARSGAVGAVAGGVITPGMAAITETPITGAEVATSSLVMGIGSGILGVGGKFFTDYTGKKEDFTKPDIDGDVNRASEAQDVKTKTIQKAPLSDAVKEQLTMITEAEDVTPVGKSGKELPKRESKAAKKHKAEIVPEQEIPPMVMEDEGGGLVGREIPKVTVDITPEEVIENVKLQRKENREKALKLVKAKEEDFSKIIKEEKDSAVLDEAKKELEASLTPINDAIENAKSPESKERLIEYKEKSPAHKKIKAIEDKVIVEEKKAIPLYKSVAFEDRLNELDIDNISEIDREIKNVQKKLYLLDEEEIEIKEGTPAHKKVQDEIANLLAYDLDLRNKKRPQTYELDESGAAILSGADGQEIHDKMNEVDITNTPNPLTGILGNQKGNSFLLTDVVNKVIDVGHSIYKVGMELQDFLVKMKLSLKDAYEKISTILPDIYQAILSGMQYLPAIHSVANITSLADLGPILGMIGMNKLKGSKQVGEGLYHTPIGIKPEKLLDVALQNKPYRDVTRDVGEGKKESFTLSAPIKLEKLIGKGHGIFEEHPKARTVDVLFFTDNNLAEKNPFGGAYFSGIDKNGVRYANDSIWLEYTNDMEALFRALSHEVTHVNLKLEGNKDYGFFRDDFIASLFTEYPDLVKNMTPEQLEAAADRLYLMQKGEWYARVGARMDARQGEVITSKTLADEIRADAREFGIDNKKTFWGLEDGEDAIKKTLIAQSVFATPDEIKAMAEESAGLEALKAIEGDLTAGGVIDKFQTAYPGGEVVDGIESRLTERATIAIMKDDAGKEHQVPFELVAQGVMELKNTKVHNFGDEPFSLKKVFIELSKLEKVGDGKILNTAETKDAIKNLKSMITIIGKKAKSRGISIDEYLDEHGFSMIAIADINAVRSLRLRGNNYTKWETKWQTAFMKELTEQGVDIPQIMKDLNISKPDEGKKLSEENAGNIIDYAQNTLGKKSNELLSIEQVENMLLNEAATKDPDAIVKRSWMRAQEEALDPRTILGKSAPGAAIYDAFSRVDYLTNKETEYLYNKEGLNLDEHLHTINKDAETVANALEGKIDINSLPKNIKEATLAMRKTYDYLLDKFVRLMARDTKEESIIREIADSFKHKEGEKVSDLNKRLKQAQTDFNISKRGMEALDMLRLREENYMPHIFDRGDLIKTAVERLSKLAKTDPKSPQIVKLKDLISRLEGGSFISQKEIPRDLLFAHTMERVGAEGYKVDAALSFRVYLNSWMKKVYLEPATNAAKDQYLLLPGEQKAYAKWFIMEQLGRNTRSKTANIVSSLEWIRTLGLNVGSALGNLTGIINTFTEAGTKPYALEGMRRAMSKEGLQEFYSSGAARQIKQIAALDELPHRLEKARAIAGVFFNVVERGLRNHAYHTGKVDGEARGLRGDELYFHAMDYMNKTQHRYGKVGMAKGMRGWKGVATQFTSYPVKQATLIHSWLKEPQGILKVLGYFAMSAGVNVTAKELLGLDMSNFLGIGISYGEAMEAAMSMTEG